MIAGSKIKTGTVIDVEVNGEQHSMLIVDVRDGRVTLSYPKGTKGLKRGVRGRWWLPIDFVKANAREVTV